MNGWKNRATWNVALWIGNDEGLYRLAKQGKDYRSFLERIERLGVTHTPDGVKFDSREVSRREMNEMIKDL